MSGPPHLSTGARVACALVGALVGVGVGLSYAGAELPGALVLAGAGLVSAVTLAVSRWWRG